MSASDNLAGAEMMPEGYELSSDHDRGPGPQNDELR